MLTVKDLTERWAVSKRVVLAFIQSGELAAVDMRSPGASRPSWRISEQAAGAFERRRTPEPKPPAPTRRRKRPNGQAVTQWV